MSGRSIHHVRRNVVAYVALFIAMGGTSYAAASLPASSVGTKQVKKNSITGAKIKTNAISAAKIGKNAITGVKIKNNAVTSAKVKDGSLLLTDFAPNQITALTKSISGGTASGGTTGSGGSPGAPGSSGPVGAKGDAGGPGSTGAAGAPGANGTNGTNGTNGATSVRIRTATSATATMDIQCNAGERAVGGGSSGGAGVAITDSMPIDSAGSPAAGSIPTGWKVTRAAGPTTVYVVCAAP